MWKLRYYWPLAGFIVPSAAIGYGHVLPCHGLSGLNELSLGFGSTLVGAAIAYVAGIAATTRTACPVSKPFRVRMNNYINSQAANPRGPFGRFLGFVWRHEHATINEATLDLLSLERGDRALEIGCGPGEALRALARRGCTALGLDVSALMVRIARNRNRRLLGSGRVAVRKIEDGRLDLERDAFDRAFSVHCIYFWAEPSAMLKQIFSALKPGGRLVLAFIPDSPLVPPRLRGPSYRLYTPEQVKRLLCDARFSSVDIVWRPSVSDRVVWTVAVKR